MDKNTFNEFQLKFFEDCNKITIKKNNDYTGNDKDAFSNFKAVEAFGISTSDGLIARMTDKLKRISSIIETNNIQVLDESLNDTLQDLVNYSVILAAYMSEVEK